jgi:hypothetical protein
VKRRARGQQLKEGMSLVLKIVILVNLVELLARKGKIKEEKTSEVVGFQAFASDGVTSSRLWLGDREAGVNGLENGTNISRTGS